MSTFNQLRNPIVGGAIKADWGRLMAKAIEELRPVQRPGLRISKTSYGTRIEFDSVAEESTTLTASKNHPYKVRWYYTNEKKTAGEWQIYLPCGCCTLNNTYGVQSFVPVNEKCHDVNGDEQYRWFKIPDPKDADGDAGKMGKYVAKQWTVYVQMKPWPRMKATTAADDKDFGLCKWSLAVATIGVVEVETDSGVTYRHPVNQMISEGGQEYTWDTSGNFALEYEMQSKSADAKVKVKVVNQVKPVGRLQKENIDPKTVTDYENVWVKISHKETEFDMSIEKDLKGSAAASDSDKTVFRIYEMKDNVVTADYRDSIPDMYFFTNGPEKPKG